MSNPVARASEVGPPGELLAVSVPARRGPVGRGSGPVGGTQDRSDTDEAAPAPRPVPVAVIGDDPVLRTGVAAQLRARPAEVESVEADAARVAVVAADELDERTLDLVRRLQGERGRPVVLVLSQLQDASLIAGVEAGVSAFVRRAEAVPDRLVPVITAAARGEATIPPDLVTCLITHVSRSHRDVGGGRTSPERLSHREVEVLRLASEGMETAEIARRLSYSERTVKGVIHDVTTRFNLRNRTHAVAYALRLGLI